MLRHHWKVVWTLAVGCLLPLASLLFGLADAVVVRVAAADYILAVVAAAVDSPVYIHLVRHNQPVRPDHTVDHIHNPDCHSLAEHTVDNLHTVVDNQDIVETAVESVERLGRLAESLRRQVEKFQVGCRDSGFAECGARGLLGRQPRSPMNQLLT